MSQHPPPTRSGRQNHDPRPSTIVLGITFEHKPHGNQKFYDVPTGPPKKSLSLEEVAPDAVKAANQAKQLTFHIIGDTGGVANPVPQSIVADKMEEDFQRLDGGQAPAFFYHLGDVVYYFGARSGYFPQFYDPYIHYPAPILGIPGNHDGDVDPTNPAPTLDAFVRNFCAQTPKLTPEAGEATRTAMTQPGAYWTLDAPYVTIVGLYTNVSEGGDVRSPQTEWFVEELRKAPRDKALLVALHHPVYSADAHHGGSQAMKDLLEASVKAARRAPDAIFSAHVHNYQRFTLDQNNHQTPYIVAGAGGYWHLHNMSPLLKGIQRPVKIKGTPVTLESFVSDRHGFMRVEVNADVLKGEYYVAPRPHESWKAQAVLWDSFSLDLKTHRLVV